jgi:hypothetical protein
VHRTDCGALRHQQDLYKQFLGKLFGTMTLPKDAATCWKKSEPSRMLFDALCRRGGSVRKLLLCDLVSGGMMLTHPFATMSRLVATAWRSSSP